MKKDINSKGFTIIEVVLVLAIAALIFLMIFVALPALQRSQKDTSRKQDASIISSAITKYTAAYRKLPTATDEAKFLKYFDKLDQFPSSTTAEKAAAITIINGANGGNADINDNEKQIIKVYTSAKCDGPDAVAGGAREAAVRIKLEDGTAYCVDAS